MDDVLCNSSCAMEKCRLALLNSGGWRVRKLPFFSAFFKGEKK